MKKILATLLLFMSIIGYSQTNGITYQAVIINPAGEQLPGVNNTNAPLANKNICLKFSIIDNNSQSEYIETVQTTTDEFGMVNLVIGTGVQIGGYASSFSNILWNANPKNLKVDLSTTGICSYYTEISNQPFTAVPFALYAVNSESAAALAALQATVAANATATTTALALKEDAANKSTTTTLGTSNLLFPTQNAVKTYVDSNITTVNANNTALQATVAANATATTAALALKENAANKSTTTTLGTSNVLFPTQNAVKTYVDSNITNVNSNNTALQATVAANATATTAALALKEDAANKSTTTTLGTSNVLFPTQNAVKTYVDSNITTVNANNTALQATVAANATATTAALALKEDAANKSTTTTLGTSNVLFPTQNAVKTYVDSQVASVTIADANATTKGKIQLAGDIGGTAAVPTVPGLANKENSANKSTTTTLGNSDVLFPTQNAVKTYVDSQISSATIADADATTKGKIQLAGDLGGTAAVPTVPGLANKENSANKSTTTTLGNSDVLFPTQNAVKTYVDSQISSATIADADATTKGKIQLAGDLTGTATAPVVAANAITTSKILDANVTDAKIATVSGSKVTGNITGSAANVTGIVPVANGGTGQTTIAAVKSILGLSGTNVAIGAASGTTNQGAGAVGVGNGTGQTNQGSQSVAIGYVAGNSNQGANSVAIGSNAAQGGQGTQSVAIGIAANSSANNATAVGGFSSAGHTNATAIGYQAVTSGSNTIQLGADGVTIPGSTAITNVKTSGTLTAGAVTYPNTHGSTGQVLSTTGSGTLTWVAPNASSLSGTVAVANGGTGATTATGALTNLGAAPLASPTFTGTPAAPTATAGSNTTQIATTEFVTGAVALATITDATTTAKGKLQLAGDLAGTAAAPTVPGLALKAPIASPTFTGTVTSPIYASTPQALTDAATIVWNPANGLNASVTLGGNRTLSFSSTPSVGSYGTLVVSQDATGGRTITLPTTSNKVLGSTSTTTIALSTAANAKDILNFYYDGTNCYWNIGQGYGTAATVASTNLVSGVSGTLPVANGGTGATTLTGLIKGNGTGAMTVAVDGTDYLSPTGSAANLTNFPTLNQNTTGNAATATTATSATNVSGTVAVANGGTGATSLTANNVLLGNGTSALQVVAPGTSGNVLTSNGTTWSSSAPAASGVPYTGATQAVNLGAYDLTVNGLTVGKGKKDVAGTAYQYNSAFGVSALGSFTGGTKNTALGFNALSSVTSTDQNIAIGAYAMGSTTDYFQQSVAVGNQSLLYNKGSFNTALGSGAISSQNLTSAATYLVGVGALALLNNSSGQNNTAIGSYALSTNTTGNNNTALGQGADVNSATLDNATAIGYNAKVSTSNSIQLGNTSVTNVKTSGTVTAGTVTYPNTHGTANQVLSTTGSGTLTWVTPVNSAASLSGTLAVTNGGNGLSTTPANGQIDIGNGTGFTRTTLTAGTAITITNTAGAITISAAVRPTTDQFTATAAQTSFTVTQTPLNAKVWMFINGVRTNNSAYSISGTTVTYTPASNNNYALVAGDRIQFDYAY